MLCWNKEVIFAILFVLLFSLYADQSSLRTGSVAFDQKGQAPAGCYRALVI